MDAARQDPAGEALVLCVWVEQDANSTLVKTLEKDGGINSDLHAGQPVNADSAAGGVTPELDELLDAEYAC